VEDDDLRLVLFENGAENRSPPPNLAEYPQLSGPLRFAPDEFEPNDGNSDDSERTGHGFARKTFRTSGRLFVAFVEAGTRPPPTDRLAELHDLLASLTVQPGDFYPGTTEPPEFAPRPGWHLGASGPEPADADGEFATAWASTIPYADEWNALPPQRTLERLPQDGIVVWIGLTRTNRFPSPDREHTVPLQLDEFERHAQWEGHIRNIPMYVLWGTVHGDHQVDARVFFGRTNPTSAMLAEAQAMLDVLQLPDWGPWELQP
jgi:hypothetical protein